MLGSEPTLDSLPTRPLLVRADSRLRNKWIAAGIFLAVILILLLWFSPSMQRNLVSLLISETTNEVFRLLIIFYSLFSIMAIILITLGLHLTQVSRKIFKYGRFPAPAMRVIHDIWVIRGWRAKLLSYLFLFIATLLILSGASMPFYFHELLIKLLTPG